MGFLKTGVTLTVLAWMALTCSVAAETSCVTVTSTSLGEILPYSTICNISSQEGLHFQGVNLTGVTFDFLEARLGVSFDGNCTFRGVRINGILVNQKFPREDASSVRLLLDTPVRDSTISLIRVNGKTEFTKKILRSTIAELYSDQDVTFRLPVRDSSIERISPATAIPRNTVSFASRIINSSIAYIGSRSISFDDQIVDSQMTNLASLGLKGYVQVVNARASSFQTIAGDYVLLGSLTNCTVAGAAAGKYVSIGNASRSSFGTIQGRGFYDSASYQPYSVILHDIANSQFDSIEAGSNGNDYVLEFAAPVRNSRFGLLRGQVNFDKEAPLYGTMIDTIVSSSVVLWESRMERTRFGSVRTTGNLLILTNTSENVASSFGDVMAGDYLAFNEPVPSTLACSSLSAMKCGVLVNTDIQERQCPMCVT